MLNLFRLESLSESLFMMLLLTGIFKFLKSPLGLNSNDMELNFFP